VIPRRSIVRGVGGYLPERVVSNAELARTVDTSDEWIVQRTGITCRHIAADGETTSDLAVHAARAALDRAGMRPDDIDLILVATATPDLTFPATATLVQHKLGIRGGFAFDLAAACSGFVYAAVSADALLKNGSARRALVIGSETITRLLDWNDRATCVLFGDGAGAMVLESVPHQEAAGRGILSSRLRADGRFWEKLYTKGGPSTTGGVGLVHMEGREVFRHAVGVMSDVVAGAFDDAGVSVDELDWFVPHQANKRIIDAASIRLGIPLEKTVVTVDRHANTSAASVPLALDVAVGDGRIKPGDLVMIEAMGGGFTWGAALIRW